MAYTKQKQQERHIGPSSFDRHAAFDIKTEHGAKTQTVLGDTIYREYKIVQHPSAIETDDLVRL